MSTEREHARVLAERIARRMTEGTPVQNEGRRENRDLVGNELAAMRATLDELQKRLARIESSVTGREVESTRSDPRARSAEEWSGQARSIPAATGVRSPWLAGMYVPAAHASQERFGVEEAAVSELVDFFESEKKCELEPGGKTCDHCAMCSSRGF